MSYYEEEKEDYDSDVFKEFGEGFEDDLNDALNEKIYEKAFDDASADVANSQAVEVEDDFEFDEVVGGRDKKPVMSLLNKGKLSKYEMDDLLNLNE
jgi:protoporphyrinogen oxidase